MPQPPFDPAEQAALALDAADPLSRFRARFHLPTRATLSAAGVLPESADPGDGPVVYLCGNSLGLQPRAARAVVDEAMDDWARLGVEGHFHARRPWKPYHERFAAPLARLVGALPHEVVAMNSLTVNLHLMMCSFYRPGGGRTRIVIEDCAFPSDSHAVASQARLHGLDPADAVVRLRPREGEHALRTADVLSTLSGLGPTVALVMLGGVNYLTGELMDIPAITAAAHAQGALCGWDLAHAAGNVPLHLHDWGADFAVWCSYKYLNAGPGAVAGAFVHERFASRPDLPRLAGWWGVDPSARFRMEPDFHPARGADGWALSNPPILSLAPLEASLELFDEATMPALRAKGLALSEYARRTIDHAVAAADPGPSGEAPVTVITPAEPERRGCQVSMLVRHDARGFQRSLQRDGVIADFREPNIVRIAPVPLYNCFHDLWRFGRVLRTHMGARPAGPGGVIS